MIDFLPIGQWQQKSFILYTPPNTEVSHSNTDEAHLLLFVSKIHHNKDLNVFTKHPRLLP